MSGKTNSQTGLQDSQQRFADEYLIDFNATAAYLRAGYKAKGNAARVGASTLLANPKVQAYLSTRKAALTRQVEITQEVVLQRLIMLTFADRRELFDERGNLKPMHELTADQAAMLNAVEIREEFTFEGTGPDRQRVFDGYTKKAKFVSPLESVKLLGTHYGLFKQTVEHSGKGGGPIPHEHTLLGDIFELVDGEDTGIGPAASRATG